MTIRAKLVAATVLGVIGPIVTIGVALAAFATLDERSDEVQRAGAREARALELKFAVAFVAVSYVSLDFAGGSGYLGAYIAA